MADDRGVVIGIDLGKILNQDEEVTERVWTRDGVAIGKDEEPQPGDIDQDGWKYVGSVQCKDKRSLEEKRLNPHNKPHGPLRKIKVFPGDKLVSNGEEMMFDKTVTVSTYAPFVKRIPTPGMADLPETDLRIYDMFSGPRVKMENVTNLRCPCGSVYTRKSETHHSCLHCKRVWTNETVQKASDEFWDNWTTNDNPW